MPRSWLTPATDVHRSAFPVSVTRQLSVRFTVMWRVVASMALQLLPPLLFSMYWLVLTASITWLVGRNCTVSVVGEYAGPAPAAAKIVFAGVGLLPLNLRSIVCGPALSGAVQSSAFPEMTGVPEVVAVYCSVIFFASMGAHPEPPGYRYCAVLAARS